MTMIETFDIAGYARISVDDEQDQKNISIENQKAIIEDYVKTHFPGSTLTFFEDRDRSGYTFEQREGYQEMRQGLMSHKYDILIVKDFSRFSRRNSRGLVELEDLRDAGVRIVSIGDGVDFPNDDDWLKIQFQFLVNEMPVTDTSRKVRSVVKRRQNDGEWICAAPYGYLVTEDKQFEIIPTEAETVRKIFDLYSNAGWGYKKIANYLTDEGVPTPRMSERMRKEAAGKKTKREAKNAWAIATVQGILDNDFYIGTLRQGKYTRAKINGKDMNIVLRVVGIIFTFNLVCFGWLLFRAEDMQTVHVMLYQIFNNFNPAIIPQVVEGYKAVFALIVLGYAMHFLPEKIDIDIRNRVVNASFWWQVALMALTIWCVMQIKSSDGRLFSSN